MYYVYVVNSEGGEFDQTHRGWVNARGFDLDKGGLPSEEIARQVADKLRAEFAEAGDDCIYGDFGKVVAVEIMYEPVPRKVIARWETPFDTSERQGSSHGYV